MGHIVAVTHNHADCVEAALATAERLCASRGVQLTPTRLMILKLIWGSHQAVKAYDLLDRIKPLKPDAKPATVYRALDFLIEQGLIHRIESLNAFIGCTSSAERHEQLLLICKHCHEVEERTASEVAVALAEEISRAGFKAHSKAIEIHGICRNCAVLPDPEIDRNR